MFFIHSVLQFVFIFVVLLQCSVFYIPYSNLAASRMFCFCKYCIRFSDWSDIICFSYNIFLTWAIAGMHWALIQYISRLFFWIFLLLCSNLVFVCILNTVSLNIFSASVPFLAYHNPTCSVMEILITMITDVLNVLAFHYFDILK